jgi:hypothetical protein
MACIPRVRTGATKRCTARKAGEQDQACEHEQQAGPGQHQERHTGDQQQAARRPKMTLRASPGFRM